MATSRSTVKKPAAKPAAKQISSAAGTKSLTAKTAISKRPATPLATKAAPAPEKKTTTRTVAPTPRKAPATPEERYKMIQDAAYYLAEKDGFHSGAMDYWMAAEIEIDKMLAGGKK